MSKDKTMFTHRELYAAAKGYDFPIILFWNKNKMAFFDKLFDAASPSGRKKTPMYLM